MHYPVTIYTHVHSKIKIQDSTAEQKVGPFNIRSYTYNTNIKLHKLTKGEN